MYHKKNSFLIGVIVGASVATITTLFLTPKSGRELREVVGEHADSAKESATEYMNLAKDKGTHMKDTVVDAGSDVWERRNEVVEDFNEEAYEVEDGMMDEAKEDTKHIDDVAERHKEFRLNFYKDDEEATDELKDTAEVVEDEDEDGPSKKWDHKNHNWN